MTAPPKPHSYLGIPEAQAALRLCNAGDAAALARLNGIALANGIATPKDDAETVVRRMRAAAEQALRWHGPGHQ